MQIKDFNKVYVLWKKAGLGVVSYEREKFEVALVLEHNPDTCFVVESGEEIIGSILGAFNGRRAWIYHLAVHPAFQRRGYGSRLLRKLEEAFAIKKVTKIILGLGFWNLKTASFYEKNGYKIMNDAILFSKELWKEDQNP